MSATPESFDVDGSEQEYVERNESVDIEENDDAVIAANINDDDTDVVVTNDMPPEVAEPETKKDDEGEDEPEGDTQSADGADTSFAELKGRFLEDGSYEIVDEKGHKQIVDASKMAPGKLRARAWWEQQEQRVQAAERRAQEVEQQRTRELDELRQQIETRKTEQQIEQKPWLAKDAKQPVVDEFDTLEEWSVANHEWLQAKTGVTPQAPQGGTQQPAATDAEARLKQVQARTVEIVREATTKFGEEFTKNCVEPDVTPFDYYTISFIDAEFPGKAADIINHYGKNMDKAWQVRELLRAGNVNQAIREVAKAEASIVAPTGGTTNSSAGKTARRSATNDSGIDTEADEATDVDDEQNYRVSKAPPPIKPASGHAPVRIDPEKETPAQYNARRFKELEQDY